MQIWKDLWRDETGVVVTAETVMVGSVGVLGGVVGLNAAVTSVNAELNEFGAAIRSLDQSYGYVGQSSCRAWTAGSFYQQQRVEQSLSELCGDAAPNLALIREHVEAQRDALHGPLTAPAPVDPAHGLVTPPVPAPAANELPPKTPVVKEPSKKDGMSKDPNSLLKTEDKPKLEKPSEKNDKPSKPKSKRDDDDDDDN